MSYHCNEHAWASQTAECPKCFRNRTRNTVSLSWEHQLTLASAGAQQALGTHQELMHVNRHYVCQTEIERLRARIARLEAALKYIVEKEWAISRPEWTFVDVAREALQESDDG